ncbi:chloramphenicol-sensitive protein RarD [Aliiroseovarius sediminilitoris]|uniref:Chloramphenicol-sensitive protein RarD n=1 Tax=Aliiroseovarius sediminilitoris TaxID=1173584 RepID=A0A1I0MP62_9RHOB|nr:EamA family transporter RarD [Aliiroseovarius sediminilitoris]SEV89670.1 chloramphenicol-sensitive protein RarD [Aliiroseovarius sediminilitoris]
MTDVTRSTNEDTPQGLGLAMSAYFLWGFLPLYMKALAHMPAVEVVAHRVIWSVPVAGVILIATGRTRALREAIANPRMLLLAVLTAGLISLNWGIYVWAIAHEQTLEAALGYYINPLFSIFLGTVLLGERMNRAQMLAVALAFLAVLILTLDAGRVPLVAVGLMLTWGFYALCKKSLPIGPNQGFMLEVLILLIPALAAVAWLTARGQSHFLLTGLDTALLLGCGVVTAVPLMLYANGAKLLRLSTIAILQYIAPTMIFLVAVFVFDEPFEGAKRIAFPLIWLALVIYTTSMLRGMRRRR